MTQVGRLPRRPDVRSTPLCWKVSVHSARFDPRKRFDRVVDCCPAASVRSMQCFNHEARTTGLDNPAPCQYPVSVIELPPWIALHLHRVNIPSMLSCQQSLSVHIFSDRSHPAPRSSRISSCRQAATPDSIPSPPLLNVPSLISKAPADQ